MAKKIVEEIKGVLKGRKKKKEYPQSTSEGALNRAVERGELVARVDPIAKLHKRLDRIVTAIHNSKSVKGL